MHKRKGKAQIVSFLIDINTRLNDALKPLLGGDISDPEQKIMMSVISLTDCNPETAVKSEHIRSSKDCIDMKNATYNRCLRSLTEKGYLISRAGASGRYRLGEKTQELLDAMDERDVARMKEPLIFFEKSVRQFLPEPSKADNSPEAPGSAPGMGF